MLHNKDFKFDGIPLEKAEKAIIMIHGRGGFAEDILSLAEHLKIQDFALVAPQAYNNSWYPLSFMAPEEQNQPWLDSALELLNALELELNNNGIPSENIYFFGFSQGACLALEYTTRNAKRYGGIIAIIGGLIGEHINTGKYITDFENTPIYLGTSDPDSHVPLERVKRTAEILRQKNAEVELKIYKNAGHVILPEELGVVNNFIFGYPGTSKEKVLARVCRQLWSWYGPLPPLSRDDIVARGHLRWARKVLEREVDSASYYECADLFGRFCVNPHHISIDSITDAFSVVKNEHLSPVRRVTIERRITRVLICKKRDDLLRQWISPGLVKNLGFNDDWYVDCFLQREDYLDVFERHDLLPNITKSLFRFDYISHLFRDLDAEDADDCVLVVHVIDLARKNATFQQTIRQYFEADDDQIGYSLWSFLLDWHLSAAVGCRPHYPLGLLSYGDDIETIIHNNLLDWLPLLEVDMHFNPSPICRAFATYKADFFIELWEAFDAKGLIDGRLFTARQIAQMLASRSDEEIQFLRNWAQAQGGLQEIVHLIDAFIQY